MQVLSKTFTYSRVLLAVVFLFGVFATFKSPGDPDFGWHYKYGEYIVQHGKLLRENTFSYTFTDYQWANSYWISQIALYLTHTYLGHLVAGLLFASVLSFAALLYVLILSNYFKSSPVLTAMSALMLFTEFSGSGVTSRPMYVSTLFLMLLITVLFSTTKRRLWLLPPLFLIWANAHADFVLGLVILGLFVAEKIITHFKKGFTKGLRPTTLYIGVGLLSAAVTLINPYWFGLWQTLIKESHPYQFSYISEWVPPSTANIYYFAAYCAVLGLIISAFIGARNKLPIWYVLALGIFCIASIRVQYFFRLAVILGLPAVMVFWTEPLSELRKVLPPSLVKKLKASLVLFVVLSTLTISSIFLTAAAESTNYNKFIKKQNYPKAALDFALTHNVKGNVFNSYGWGGYMIWNYPQVKTFVDGRMPSWREGNKSVFEDYIKISNSPKKHIGILHDYNVNWILYPTDSTLVRFLQTPNSGWTEIYSDDTASVFVESAGLL